MSAGAADRFTAALGTGRGVRETTLLRFTRPHPDSGHAPARLDVAMPDGWYVTGADLHCAATRAIAATQVRDGAHVWWRLPDGDRYRTFEPVTVRGARP